jgi:DNA-binding NarL/FixJ family response regulator
VEQLYARELQADQAGGVGYLLKDRVFNDEAFTAAICGVAAGGTVLDPEVVQKLMVRRSRDEPVARPTPREREVLALMAEGRSNAAIAQRMFITEKAVSKHAAGIFGKLDLSALGRRQPPGAGRAGLPRIMTTQIMTTRIMTTRIVTTRIMTRSGPTWMLSC